MRKIVFITSLSFGLLATNCFANFYSGNEIYARLSEWKSESSSNVVQQSVGAGYVIGVYDALDGLSFCSPGGVNQGQIRDIVFNYLRDNPQIRQKDAYILVAQALNKAFPCKK